MQKGFIYGLSCDGQVRYVGKTTSTLRSRLLRHIREARSSSPGARHVFDWIRSVGYDIEIVSLEKDPPDLGAAEAAWIATLRAYGCDLTNVAAGGNGAVVYGRTPWNKGKRGVSEETRKRMSESARKRGGHPHTAESRRKLSEGRKGTEWIREAGRKGALARAANPRVMAWKPDDPRWESMKGRPLSDAHRAAISAGHQRRKDALTMSGDARP